MQSPSKISKETYLWDFEEALKHVNVSNELSSDSDEELTSV